MRALTHVSSLSIPRTIGLWLLASCFISACSNNSDSNNPPQETPVTSLEVEQDIDWLNDGTRDVGFSIDAIPFTVQSDSTVSIDVLSAGAFNPAMDAQIYLAPDDGSIESLDLVYTNDDGEAGSDGSTLELDSFLSVELPAGNYVVYIGACCFSAQDALNGFHRLAESAPEAELTPGDVNGRYRLTITGDVEL
ncbi:MAG: DVUA0089 family protein [Halioglobus sp.]|nr:DVUA0089 family protein [Halioglobus sp.]